MHDDFTSFVFAIIVASLRLQIDFIMTPKDSSRPQHSSDLNGMLSNSLLNSRASYASHHSPNEEDETHPNHQALNLRATRISSSSLENSLESSLFLSQIHSSEGWHSRSMRAPKRRGSSSMTPRERMLFLSNVLDEAIQINQEFLMSEDMRSGGSSRMARPAAQ